MKAGKSSNLAILRTMTAKEGLNFATRRLLKDYEEFEKNTIPTVGVSARPLDDDPFVWHANIRGPEGTPYEGGVFHLELRIPETYPHNPPTVELFVDLPHPNVFGRSICLDMLTHSRTPGQGWSSGYTIMSILIQLQSFLFEKFYDDKEKEKSIKKAIEQANQYKCTKKSCKHGGKLAAWPPFSAKETDLESFKIIEEERELFRKELVCYHTKLTYEENPLGLGLSISRIARSGLIKQASPCLDYLSLKAFIKEGIRESSNNEKFTHWLPLFFGTHKDRTLHLGKKAISMICAGSTKRFKETMILDLFPKILVTLSVLIMNEKRHASIRILKIFLHVHYLYITFLNEYPQLLTEVEKTIDEFIKDEAKRHKEVIQSLGAFQTNFIVLWDKLESALPAIQQEQFDRQVFWILKSVPELVDEANDTYLDSKRTEVTFAAQITSYQVLLFWVMISKFFRSNFKSIKELSEFYEKNLGRLTDKMESEIQSNCFKILKISNYDQMFEYMGMGKISQEELNKRLKEAIKNSKRRKYHGTDDEILTLPSREEQIKNLEQHFPTASDYIDAEKKTIKELPETEWRNNCIKRWLWIRDLCENDEKLTAAHIANIADDLYYHQYEKRPELLVELKNKYLQNMSQLNAAPSNNIRYKPNYTWKELFLKLDLENFLVQIDNNPDFKAFYARIQTVYPYISSLVIPITSVKNIKSGHYYLTALLTELVKLKHIQIVGTSSAQELTLSALKALAKGFNNFMQKGGQLEEIKFGKFTLSTTKPNEVQDKLFNSLLNLTEIKTLTCENNNMFYSGFNGSKSIAKMILTHKNLSEINLKNVSLNDSQAKDIADSLMRAKGLEILNLSSNTSLKPAGLTSVIYNLAFSPKLYYLDISRIPITSDFSNLVEAIYKLLRISASLEVLNLSYCGSLNCNLPEQFFVALGEVRTLKKLDLSFSGSLNSTACTNLGKAIAFNAKKFGSLEHINLDGNVISSYHNLTLMYEGMHISDADHESWYGDANKVSKMSGKDFAKTYYNNLKSLQVNGCALATNFDVHSWKKQYNPQDPPFVKLIARSKELTNLQLARTNFSYKDADILALALDPTRAEFCSKVRILNLSRNNLGKEGVKTLATIFEKNNIIEVLDISHNQLGVAGAISLAQALTNNKSLKYLNLFSNKIDVDGARAFEKTLKTNTSLEYIDFGHNRLRGEGLNAIARGIAANKDSGIKHLGLRFNFIDADSVISFFKKVFTDGKSKIENLFIKNNYINEFGLYDILKVHKKMELKTNIDIFDKLKWVENDILERTVWVHPAPGTPDDVKRFFETTHQCGIVLSVRKRTGPKWPNRNIQSNTFYFVEFASPVSVTRALHVASRKEAYLCGVNVRIFKAGSGTYNYTKSKKKQIGKTKTNFVGRPQRKAGKSARGGGRGRGRGRR